MKTIFLMFSLSICCIWIEAQNIHTSPYFKIMKGKGDHYGYKHHRIYYSPTPEDKKSFKYLGSFTNDSWGNISKGYVKISHRNMIISEDGKSITYEHNAELAGKESNKESGLYHLTLGQEEKLILPVEKFIMGATNCSKPFPSGLLFFQQGKDQSGKYSNTISPEAYYVNDRGKIWPLLVYGGNQLHYAVIEENDSVIESIIEYDSDLMNEKNYWELTPLEIAVLLGKQQTAIQLLQSGASYKRDEHSLLYLASMYKRAEVVNQLLQMGFPYDDKSIDGRTAFHAVVAFWSIDGEFPAREDNIDEIIATIESYLKNGADINFQNGNGHTLLHYGTKLKYRTPNDEYVKFLIDKGIDVNIQDEKGNTALHYFSAWFIKERIKSIWEKEKLPLLELVTARMNDIDQLNKKGESPLQYAVQGNYINTADYLIKQGANPNVKFIYGGMGPEIPGETVKERIESIRSSSWWHALDDRQMK